MQALIEKRLLLSDMRDGEQVVEVAHESLLRQWETLAIWLREEREDLKEADRLEQAVAAWNRSGRKADWLMEGERLSISEALAAKPGYRQAAGICCGISCYAPASGRHKEKKRKNANARRSLTRRKRSKGLHRKGKKLRRRNRLQRKL